MSLQTTPTPTNGRRRTRFPQWTSARTLRDGPITRDVFGFLTTEANAEVRAHHDKAMPVILTTEAERDL
jgi:putative SOS response-associated peptidase YedK